MSNCDHDHRDRDARRDDAEGVNRALEDTLYLNGAHSEAPAPDGRPARLRADR
jgi:hypothetical protein